MATLPLTRSKHVIPFSSLLRKTGEPVDRLLMRAQLPANCLDDPDTPIPSDAAFRFRELASQTLGLATIAIDATRHLKIADLGKFGRALFQAPTLYRLLMQFRDLVNTQTTMATIQVEQRKCGDVSFCHGFDHIPESGVWNTDVYILQWTIKLVRLVDPAWSPTEVWSMSPEALASRQAIEQLGAESVTFGRRCTGFLIPSSMLAMPLTRDVAADAEQVDANRLREAALPDSYSVALQQVITTYASDRWLSTTEAGEVLGVSVRTIQRRLAKDRTTYRNVLERTRAAMAGELLETTDATIKELAAQLGYVDQGNFTRAFRRWAGVSPRDYRHQRTLS